MLQASFSFAALLALICLRGEKRVPARSWLNIGQSVAGFGTLTACCALIAWISSANRSAAAATITAFFDDIHSSEGSHSTLRKAQKNAANHDCCGVSL